MQRDTSGSREVFGDKRRGNDTPDICKKSPLFSWKASASLSKDDIVTYFKKDFLLERQNNFMGNGEELGGGVEELFNHSCLKVVSDA